MRRLFMVLCFALAGCGEIAPPAADFVFITDAVHNSRDPQKMSYMHDIRLVHNLFETLVSLDFSDMSIQPAAATHWEISPDGRTYTFYLRPQARWSNGDPVTSTDFVYAWRRAMTPDLASTYAELVFYIRGAKDFFNFRNKQLEVYARNVSAASTSPTQEHARLVWEIAIEHFDETVGLETPDDHTLVVHLKNPTPFFLQLAAFSTYMPVHAESVSQATKFDARTGRWWTDPRYWRKPDELITNGPYRVQDVKFRQYTHMIASETYWNRSAMRNTSIRELNVSSPETALLLCLRGQADFWPSVKGGKFGEDLLKQNRDDLHSQTMAGTYYYNFNCKAKLPDGRDNPLADVRVRRAMSMAIDRKALTEYVTGLNQPPAYTFIPPAALGNYDPPVEAGVHFDPQAARQLLADAGYADPATLTGLSILYAPISIHDEVAQAIKYMWKQNLGVEVALESVDTKAASQRRHDKQYTITRSSWYGDYPDPNTWLEIRISDAPNNTASWSNTQYDALMKKTQVERNPEIRLQLLRDAETILMQGQSTVPLFHDVVLHLYDPQKVKYLNPNAWGRWRMEFVEVQR